jgi:hypothetical protein
MTLRKRKVCANARLTRMLMSRMLTRLGHQVTTAENGKIALDVICDSFDGKETAPKFDVVFLDKCVFFPSSLVQRYSADKQPNAVDERCRGCTGSSRDGMPTVYCWLHG